MKPEIIQLMKNAVNRFDISTETYYHAVFLFNIIQLKKTSENQPDHYLIPIRKRNSHWSSGSESDKETNLKDEVVTEYMKIDRPEMPSRQKLEFTVCLFLTHKLHQSYPVSLLSLINHLEIDERLEQYIISLEKEFLSKLDYKIQTILPSNQTLYTSQLWDHFTQNISPTCVDVRFGIDSIFQQTKKQNKNAKQTKENIVGSEFQTSETRRNFDALMNNIEAVVHDKKTYSFFLKKLPQSNQEDFPTMKKIALAITYVTIFNQTSIVFCRKYPSDKKDKKKSGKSSETTDYLNFIFNDFLEYHFNLNLKQLNEEINLVKQILQHENRILNAANDQKKQGVLKSKAKKYQKQKWEFLYKTKQKTSVKPGYLKSIPKNCRQNLSISQNKTDNESEQIKSLCLKSKYCSIFGQSSKTNHKYLESTLYQSNLSEKASSLVSSNHISKKQKIANKQNKMIQMVIKSGFQQNTSSQTTFKAYSQKRDTKKHGSSLANSKVQKKSRQIHYSISQFNPNDA